MKKAELVWVEGMQFVGSAGSHAVVMDSSGGDGRNTGPSPMEMLLLGVLGCTGMDVISILRKKRQQVTGLKIYAEGEQNHTTPFYYTKIHLRYVATGDVDPEALRRAIELSETKYCSAMATLNGKTQFSSEYHVENLGAVASAAVAG